MTYESVYFPESCEQGLGWTGWPVQVSNMPRVLQSVKVKSSQKKKKQKSESQIFSKKEKKSESQNSNMGPN